MAILAFTAATIWAGQADLSNRTNEVTLEASAADLDVTNFASGGWQARLGGLRSAKCELKGQWDADAAGLTPDTRLWGDLGVSGVPVTVAPLGSTVGNVAYFGTFMQPMYKPGGKVGDVLAFDTSKVADAPLIRGQVANSAAVTSTGTTTGLNLGAVAAGQRIWCALHLLAVTGTGSPTITATVQSASSSGFASPTTVVTGTALSAAGFQYLQGPVGVSTDTWQRLSLVVTGTTPSFTLYAAIGIG